MNDQLTECGTDTWPVQPRAGVLMHISSLPGRYGIGDIGDAAHAFLQELARMGMSAWQFLPIGPTGFGDSPYQSLSTFAGNELLVSPGDLLRQGLLHKAQLEPLEALPADRVDYVRLAQAKQQLLGQVTQQFDANAGSDLKAGYAAFCQAHDAAWLDEYALFRVLKTHHEEQAWTDWAVPLARRDCTALTKAAARYAREIEHVRIIQFLFYRQWAQLRRVAEALGIRLLGDVPIYLSLDSADAWANRSLLQLNRRGRPVEVAGVPPDYFSQDGQLWGNPLYRWAHHAADGHAWWTRRLAHALSLYDLVRLDHFRGFESYWSIKYGAENARQGRWRRGPGKRLFDDLTAALGPLPLVAEDLGELTDKVHALRRSLGIPGMQVLQFAIEDPEFSPEKIREDTVCYTGTHDNDTTQGWFHGGAKGGRAIAELKQMRRRALAHTRGRACSIHIDLARLAFSSKARLAVVPVQDMLGLGSEARMNTPGSITGNWQWRLRAGQLNNRHIADIAELVSSTSRA